MAARGKSARNKGAAGEREFFAILNRFLPERLRVQRDLSQTRDGGADAVVGGVVIEVKRQESIRLNSWLKQARKAAETWGTHHVPVVAYRKNHGHWRCVVEMTPQELAAYMRYKKNIDDTIASIDRAVADL